MDVSNNKMILEVLKQFYTANEIIIPEDKTQEFKDLIISKISMYMEKNIEENIENEDCANNKIIQFLGTKIFLTLDDNGNFLGNVKFCYDKDIEINPIEVGKIKNKEKDYNINHKKEINYRDYDKETEIIKELFIDGFEINSKQSNFIMKDEESMYNFLKYRIEKYMENYEILASEEFTNKKVRKPKLSSVGVKIDNGLLNIDMSKFNVDADELKQVLQNYQIKKKYFKLKDGSFLDLNKNEDLDIIDELTTNLDVDFKKIENGIIKVPVHRSIYLQNMLNKNKIENVTKDKSYTDIVNNISNKDLESTINIPKQLEDKLRDYQKTGFKWLKVLEHYNFGGILADDMGLGKTIQIIALIKSYLETGDKKTSIVVCPSSLVINWKVEIEKWCPQIKVKAISGIAIEREKLIQNLEENDLIITSYDLLKRDIEKYEQKDYIFQYIIADEAQYIKNYTTKNATSLKTLKGDVKYALTGTPIENSIAELWSIFDYIMPGYLYNYNKFQRKFETPIISNNDKDALEKLKMLIEPFVLRRVKKDVLTELPDKNITIFAIYINVGYN